MTDEEEKLLKQALLAVDLSLRRKQEFWETPRNIAILVGVTAAIAAAIGFWIGSRESPAPNVRPVGVGAYDPMTAGQFIDAMQTATLVVIAVMLIYVVVRLDRTLTLAAEKILGALAIQQVLQESIERVWKRLEATEQRMEERNAILPTAKLGLTLDEIRARLDQLETRNDDHQR
jgi:hypothetical protein